MALAQLGTSLDLGQQLAQRQPILGRATAAPVKAPAIPDDQGRLLKARADREELALQMDAAKAAEMDGRWIVTQEAREEWSRQLSELIQAVETWLVSAAASEISAAAAAGAGPRDLGKLLKSGFRELRQRLADQAARGGQGPADDSEDDDDIEAEP